jgi:hypothetical protein
VCRGGYDDGGGGSEAVCVGGRGCDWTRPTGYGWAAGAAETGAGGVGDLLATEPVKGFSLKRPMSELHAAILADITATAARRDVTRAPDMTKEGIFLLARYWAT